MRRTKIFNPVEVRRTTHSEAQNAFIKHCRLKNLRPQTVKYDTEDLTYFHAQVPVKYIKAHVKPLDGMALVGVYQLSCLYWQQGQHS